MAKANLKVVEKATAQKKEEPCRCDCCHDMGGDMVWYIGRAHGLLSIVRAWQKEGAPSELKGEQLDGVFVVMDTVYDDLQKAMDAYFKAH